MSEGGRDKCGGELEPAASRCGWLSSGQCQSSFCWVEMTPSSGKLVTEGVLYLCSYGCRKSKVNCGLSALFPMRIGRARVLSCLTNFEELIPCMRVLLPWPGLWLEPHSGEEYANYSLSWWQYLHEWCKQWNTIWLTSLALAFVNWIQRFWSVCGESVGFRQDAPHTAVIRQEMHSWWNQFWLRDVNTSYSKNIAALFRDIYISIFNRSLCISKSKRHFNKAANNQHKMLRKIIQ